MVRSAKTLRVSGKSLSAFSICTAIFSISLRSAPKTFTPSFVRKPVVSISVRVWIGIQKMLAMPGVLIFSFISAMSFSHVIPARH